MASSRPPGLRMEQELVASGRSVVVGLDEVGKGSWAGPLTVGAAVVGARGRPKGIRDSKLLSPATREVLYDRIVRWAAAWAVGHASAAECDELGMSDAQRLATRRALGALGVVPDAVLVDGSWDFVSTAVPSSTTVRTIVKGDRTSLSIAAASILAKVTRDRIMRDLDADYPYYAFASNKGYPCPRHKVALQGYGPSAIHRRSWVFMDSLVWTGLRRPLVELPEQLELLDAALV